MVTMFAFATTAWKSFIPLSTNSEVSHNKALQSDKIAGYAANFAAERERYVVCNYLFRSTVKLIILTPQFCWLLLEKFLKKSAQLLAFTILKFVL